MTDAEKREAARLFIQKWQGRGKEDEDDRSFWFDLLQDVLGQEHITDRIQFQKKVIGADGNTKRIDAYIPETKVIIEQKSLNIALDKPQYGHDGMTPYEQAKMYDNALPHSEKAKWIVLSNFAEIWIYDMDERVPEPTKIKLEELQEKRRLLDFLIKDEVKRITEELNISLDAGKLVGQIYDSFLKQYNDPESKENLNSLNVLCVRLVFCMYAEDAGLFSEANHNIFREYIEQFEPNKLRRALIDLFEVLNTPEDMRDEYLEDELAIFPYVNGGLFADENIIIPPITQDIKETLIKSAKFDWSRISPTIFGAVFESTLNKDIRRSGGMHYTSIENIHKVIDPLFLDKLKQELKDIKAIKVEKTKNKKLREFQDKLASLTFLDPAAGSGNFLTETFLWLRKLENEIIDELYQGQIVLGVDYVNPIKVSISQFYGIEINDFAVSVSKTALWIAESQMIKKTEDIVHTQLDFLPLKTSAHIVEGNALRIDWNDVVPASELNYIMGNPPFAGRRYRTKEQQEDVALFFKYKDIDYVACWYANAAKYIKNTLIECAFVSTNSITQGEQVPELWRKLLNHEHIYLNFAYRTFRWDSEAAEKAAVYCVVIGFSCIKRKDRFIVPESLNKASVGRVPVDTVNGYLLNAPNVFVENRAKPLFDVPEMRNGNVPLDGDALKIEPEDLEEFKDCPFVKQLMGGRELLHNEKRYVLWLVDAKPNEIKQFPSVEKRVELCRERRLAMKDKATRKLADTPTTFRDTNNPTNYIALPMVSSERRRYIPMQYLHGDVIPTNQIQTIPDATIYHFGILTSNVHMAWMRAVAGRLEMRYRYSKGIVYNNFPWIIPTKEQKQKIEETAQGILDVRDHYSDNSLAELYDYRYMPIELQKAHQANDRAVMQAYGFNVRTTSEEDCVARLLDMYKELTDSEKNNKE